MNPLHQYVKNFKSTIRWTPAHLVKRNSMSVKWSRDDCLNHVADKVAMGRLDFVIDCQYQHIDLEAEDIIKDQIQPNSWNL